MLIVNLEEFSTLCGVTPETMRVHIREVEGSPDWLVERGERGRGYKIEAEGGVAWWEARREADALVTAERAAQLAQMRLALVGGAAEDATALALSGKQRRDEYGATFEAIKLKRVMGALVETAHVERILTGAGVELRRRLLLVPGEFAATQGLDLELVAPLEAMMARAVDDFVTTIAAATATEGGNGG